MSSRAPIQVPGELKEELGRLQDEVFHTKTLYEVIHKLIEYYDENEIEKKKAAEYQENSMLDIGIESKERFARLKEEMNFQRDNSVFEVLAEHWESSPNINKAVFTLSRELQKKEGKSRWGN